MSDFPPTGTTLEPPGVISALGTSTLLSDKNLLNRATQAASAIGTANRAYYILFVIETTCTVYKIAWENGGTVNGNVDVGIYDENLVLLVSSGSTAQSGTSTVQVADITDTTLPPGLYYMALATDSTTATFFRSGLGSVAQMHTAGIAQQASAFPLPNPASFTAHSASVPTSPPIISLLLRPEM